MSTLIVMLRICWAIDGIALLVGLYFFFDNIDINDLDYGLYSIQFALLGLIAGILLGSYWLLNNNHPRWAILLAAPPAVLATLIGLWMLFLWLTYQQGGNTK